MNLPRLFICKIISVAVSVIAGLCLYMAIVSAIINLTILNPEFHKELFSKYNIYNHAEKAVNESISSLLKDVEKYYPHMSDRFMNVLGAIDSKLTREMVRSNLDNIREGIFRYFSDEVAFLPDIYLNTSGFHTANSPETGAPALNSNEFPASINIINKIEKINLEAILTYLNRYDIIDGIMAVKLICNILKYLPLIGVLAFLAVHAGFISIGAKPGTLRLRLRISLLLCGALSLVSGLLLHTAVYAFLEPVASSLPLERDVSASYILASVTPATRCLVLGGVALLLLPFLLHYLLRKIKVFFGKKPMPVKFKSATFANQFIRVFFSMAKIRSILTIILFLLTLIKFGLTVYAAGKSITSGNLSDIVHKLAYKDTQKIRVIPAENSTIYAFSLRVVERETGLPVTGIEVQVAGESWEKDRFFNEQGTTNEDGTKLILAKGTFRCSFIQNEAIEEFYMPSPFYFELKESGTTIITVYLDRKVNKPGIIELEVLDGDYNPIEGAIIKLNGSTLESEGQAFYSVTNADGIAVFRMMEGVYELEFAASEAVNSYKLPLPFNVESISFQTNRYTVCLVKSKETTGEMSDD